MASSNNDTEMEWLKSEIIPKLLKDHKILDGEIAPSDLDKFHVENITIQFIGSQEAFMLTKCYRARIEYNFKGALGEINFFVKRTPTLPQEVFDGINFKALFTNEILAYEKIIPALESYGNINLNTAKFYYGNLKSNEATLITEDFGSNGWMVTKDKFNLSLEHTLLAMKYLAKFHAIGFALMTKDKSQFEEIVEGLQESRFASDLHPEWALILKCGLKRSVKATKNHQKTVPDSFLNKYKDLFNNPTQYCRQVVQPKEPYVTLCHGDYLRNNVAYKYGDDNQPTNIMMFDLQTLRVSSPMLDLAIFLSLSTFAAVRQTHFKKIFQTYCEQLKESYEKLTQLPVPEYLRFEPLLKEYIKFLPYTIFICSAFLLEMVEPHALSIEEKLNGQLDEEEIIYSISTRGGEIVDRELADQLKELYELATQNNVEIF